MIGHDLQTLESLFALMRERGVHRCRVGDISVEMGEHHVQRVAHNTIPATAKIPNVATDIVAAVQAVVESEEPTPEQLQRDAEMKAWQRGGPMPEWMVLSDG